MTRRKTTAEFIREAKAAHGDKYDYSKTKYFTSREKVIIICEKHGEFAPSPFNHLRGSGCPQCGSESSAKIRAYSRDSFVQASKRVHDDKYDYSLVEYVNSKTKVQIICPIHGIFYQAPVNHICMEQGCFKCSYEISRRNKFSSNLDEFVSKSRKIHRNKYDYSKTEYVNSKTKVQIICPIHGEFLQEPSSHLFGKGCPYCGGTGKLSTKVFIDRATKMHNGKYDYSLVNYINVDTPVEIICPIHGNFYQLPITHLYRGSGCQKCQTSLGERSIVNSLSKLGINFISQKRFGQCRYKQPLPFDFYFQIGNKQFLIEYDGPQHFFVVRAPWSTKERLEIIQRRDAIKTKFAQDNGFILIRIPYTEFDNIETIIKTEIQKYT